MAYIATAQLSRSIESLQRFHAFYGVTFLSMKQTGVQVSNPTIWGSQQEEALLSSYFSPNGAPPGKPYCVPFGRPDRETWFWKNAKYSGGTLQSARSRDSFSEALEHPTLREWAFSANYLDKLAALLPDAPNGAKLRIPVFDVTAWFYRQEELTGSFDDLEARFRAEFRLNDAEYAQLFDPTPPLAAQYFGPEPISEDELAQLIHGVPPGPAMMGRSEDELIRHLEYWIAEEEGLTLPAGFVRAFYGALLAQRFVVLAGRPGTGKTAFVRAFSEALGRFFANSVSLIEVCVGSDFTETDVLGYERLSGGLAATELSKKLFLSKRPKDMYVVLLDEMNLSQVDHYLARLLPALESDMNVDLPGHDSLLPFPADAFLVGTVNSFLEEPTRFPLSGPVKRRANIIEMPNALGELVAAGNRTGFNKACFDLLKQTKSRIDKRMASGFSSVLDGFRQERVNAALSDDSEIRVGTLGDIIWAVCTICARVDSTSLTFGVVQDILDYVAMSGLPWSTALSEQLATKVVPQLSGPASVCEELLEYVTSLDASTGVFSAAVAALEALLRTKDMGTGHVLFRY